MPTKNEIKIEEIVKEHIKHKAFWCENPMCGRFLWGLKRNSLVWVGCNNSWLCRFCYEEAMLAEAEKAAH